MRFSLTPCPADWTDSPHTIVTSGEMPCDPETLFHMLVSPDEWPQWFPTIKRGWVTSEGPTGVGSSRAVNTGLVTLHEVFTHYEPGVRWAFTVDWTTLPLWRRFMEDYRFEDLGDGRTRLTWTIRYETGTLLRLVHPIQGPAFERSLHQAVKDLAAYVATRCTRRSTSPGPGRRPGPVHPSQWIW